MRKVLFLLFGFIYIALFFYWTNNNKESIEKEMLEKLNLQLTGVVDEVNKVKGYNGTGIVKVRIISSNLKYYDPRPDKNYYYCIVNGDYAEIYDGNTQECFIGDTIKIDTKAKLISWMNAKKRSQKYTIWLNTSDRFYNYLRENTSYRLDIDSIRKQYKRPQ